jgi:SAM-dependent methyltransferase
MKRTELEMIVIEEETDGARRLVRTGVLHSRQSRHWYPVINYVPVMLTFPTRLTAAFARDHADVLRNLEGYIPPSMDPMPGERNVQTTFTEEWSGLGAAPITFVYTDEELEKMHRVWLRQPAEGDASAGVVLDVGCGFGREARVLSRLFPTADVLGVDLNLSLLEAAEELKGEHRVHLVIASLFHLPFADGVADHVHSEGVIHHTFSTKDAFDAIVPFCKPDGSLFIWVYAKEDPQMIPGVMGRVRRALMVVNHGFTRPVLSRLPPPLRKAAIALLAAGVHPFLRARVRHGDEWTFDNTMHVLRDGFTPRYIHRHGFNEVLTWFEDAGFSPAVHSPVGLREATGRVPKGIGVLGRKTPPDSAS